MPASSFQQQKLRVCEVCSAYLGLHDNDRRLADHFGGKLHLGFIEIREKLEKLRVRTEQLLWFAWNFSSVVQRFSLSFCFCSRHTESRYRETRTNATEKTRGTWKRRKRATVGGGAGTRTRAGTRTWKRARMGERTRQGEGAQEVRRCRVTFTTYEEKGQPNRNWFIFCFRSRSRSGDRYRYVSSARSYTNRIHTHRTTHHCKLIRLHTDTGFVVLIVGPWFVFYILAVQHINTEVSR